MRRPLLVNICVLLVAIDAEWRSLTKRVTAEHDSDLSLSCTFHSEETEEVIVQWLYQNVTDRASHGHKNHWRPLFLNAQSLTPSETRYSIQQKIQPVNESSLAYSTILTLGKISESDEGLYMCKSLALKTIQMTYQVRVIESLAINPTEIIIPTDEIGQYSIRLSCILTDLDDGRRRRHPEIYWWHNNKRLGSQTNRYARIVKNISQHTFISTLFYTGKPSNVVGNYVCESEPLRKSISVALQVHDSADRWSQSQALLMWIMVGALLAEYTID